MALSLLLLPALVGTGVEEPAPDFDREVRPILSEHCFACHGPDEAARESGLRLDTPEGAFGDLGGGAHAVVAGDLEASELWDRVLSDDPSDVMWTTTYGDITFAAAVRRDNVIGCQFHPEKSQHAGLRFLRAFILGGGGS